MPNACPACSAPIPPGARYCGACGASSSPGSPPSPGADGSSSHRPPLPPRYEFLKFLGRGGMGRVYLCRDRELQVEVAVKVLPPDLAWDASSLEQIEQEARTTARLRGSPRILTLYGM